MRGFRVSLVVTSVIVTIIYFVLKARPKPPAKQVSSELDEFLNELRKQGAI